MNPADPAAAASLALSAVRFELDDLDARLLPLLTARAALVERAARAKEALGLPVRDRARERELILRAPAGLPREMYTGIVRASRRWQERMRESADQPPPELIGREEALLFDRAPTPVCRDRTLALATVVAVLLGLLAWVLR